MSGAKTVTLNAFEMAAASHVNSGLSQYKPVMPTRPAARRRSVTRTRATRCSPAANDGAAHLRLRRRCPQVASLDEFGETLCTTDVLGVEAVPVRGTAASRAQRTISRPAGLRDRRSSVSVFTDERVISRGDLIRRRVGMLASDQFDGCACLRADTTVKDRNFALRDRAVQQGLKRRTGVARHRGGTHCHSLRPNST